MILSLYLDCAFSEGFSRAPRAPKPPPVKTRGYSLCSEVLCFTGNLGPQTRLEWEQTLHIPSALLGPADAWHTGTSHTCLACVDRCRGFRRVLQNAADPQQPARLSWGSRTPVPVPRSLSQLSEPLGVF